jgi:hypothetical protein
VTSPPRTSHVSVQPGFKVRVILNNAESNPVNGLRLLSSPRLPKRSESYRRIVMGGDTSVVLQSLLG